MYPFNHVQNMFSSDVFIVIIIGVSLLRVVVLNTAKDFLPL